MANDEEVDDFGGLESSVTQAEDVRMEAGEQPAPQTGPRKDHAAEVVLPGEDAPAVAATATEDPAVPSFAGGGVVFGVLCLGPYLCDTKSRLLRRFRRLGLCKQPLLMILILWRPQTQCLLMIVCLVLNLGLGRLMVVSLGACFPGLKSRRMKIWIILLR
jgi:hypothetical protein